MPVVLCPWEEPLLVAAVNGQIAGVQEELDKGQNVDSRDLEYGRTALAWAAECGHEDIVLLLLARKANVNALDLQGRSPLLQAASNGHDSVVRRLLAAGAKIETRDTSGQTALILAAKVGSDVAIGCLLEAGADLDVQDWRDGRTALSWAADKGHEKTVEILLNGSAAVDLVDKRHRTPMAWAAMNGHTTVVKLCLRWNASTATQDADYDRTPFMWAIKKGHDDVIEILKGISPPEMNYGLEIGPEPTPSERLDELQKLFRTVKPDFDWRKNQGGELLLWAIKNDGEEDVEFLIQQGADVNALDDNGMTPLSNAAHKRLSHVAKLLLERDNVNPDHVDKCDRTPISWAAESGAVEIARLLMERNVKLELKDDTGMTPLLWAAAWEHEEIASMLLDRGVDPNCEDENLRTPLSFAAENGQNSLASLLLEKGALPNQGAEESPLMYAVSEDNMALAELLLGKGADPYSDDYSIVELPPLVLAASHGNEKMLSLFLDQDADSGKVKKDHIWTALLEACREGKYGVVKLLLDQRPFDGLKRDNLDDGPMYYAKLWGHGDIVELLRPYYPAYESK